MSVFNSSAVKLILIHLSRWLLKKTHFKTKVLLLSLRGIQAELNRRLYLDVPLPQCTAACPYKFNHLALLSFCCLNGLISLQQSLRSSAIVKTNCIRMCKRRTSPYSLNTDDSSASSRWGHAAAVVIRIVCAFRGNGFAVDCVEYLIS